MLSFESKLYTMFNSLIEGAHYVLVAENESIYMAESPSKNIIFTQDVN